MATTLYLCIYRMRARNPGLAGLNRTRGAAVFLWNPGRGTCVLAAALIAASSFTAARTASALDIAACDQFAWPIKREQALFASKDLQHVASGTTLDSVPDRGIALELQPHDTAPYVLAPSRQPKIANSSGGLVVISNVRRLGHIRLRRPPRHGSKLSKTANPWPRPPIAASAIARMFERA